MLSLEFVVKGNLILERLSHPIILILLIGDVFGGNTNSFSEGQFSNLTKSKITQLSGIMTLSRFGQSTNLRPPIKLL